MSTLLLAVVLGVTSASPFYGIATTKIPRIQNVRIGKAAIVTLNTGMTPPRVLEHFPPAYTDEARELGIEGTVTVQAKFDINGNFQVLGVVKSLGHGLDERAIAVIDGWLFSPAYRSGARVAVVANIDVPFSLARSRELDRITTDQLRDIEEVMARALAARKELERSRLLR